MNKLALARMRTPGYLADARVRHANRLRVTNATDIENLPHFLGGRDARPRQAITVIAPDGSQIVIAGMGHATAAEIQDVAYEAWAKAHERAAKNGGRVFNFEEAREREGLARSEDVPRMIADAFAERRAKHLANPRTDPAPVPEYHTKAELVALDEEIKRLQEMD